MPSTVAPSSCAQTRRFDERAVGGDVERGEPARHALADDQRRAVGRDDRAVRERRARRPRRARVPSGSTAMTHVLVRLLAGVHVEAEVADVRAARCASTTMSLHAPGRERGEIGVDDERAVGLEPQHLAVEHRDDEHAAVGQPAEPRRLLRHLDDRLRVAVGGHRDDALVVLVGEPEPVVVPARTLGEREVVEEHGRGACAHGSGTVLVAGCRVRRADVVERAAADSGSSGTTMIATRSAPMPVSAIERPSPPSGSESPPASPAPRLSDVAGTRRRNAPGRNRTCDLALRRRALYPLSYGRAGRRKCRRVGERARSAGGPTAAPRALTSVICGELGCAPWKSAPRSSASTSRRRS